MMPSKPTSLNVTAASSFVYTPPPQATGAQRVLIKPNLGYRAKAPATVSLPVLVAVLRGLRAATPDGEIFLAEGVTGKHSAHDIFAYHNLPEIIDSKTVLVDAEALPMARYPNRLPQPIKYAAMIAPRALQEFDCVLSVAPFKRTTLHGQPLYSASLKNLYGLFPRSVYHGRSPYARGQLHRPGVAQVLRDVYFTIGHYIHGAVVDLTYKYSSPDWKPDRQRGVAFPVGSVVTGTDMLAVDAEAARIAGEAVPDYIAPIRALREAL